MQNREPILGPNWFPFAVILLIAFLAKLLIFS